MTCTPGIKAPVHLRASHRRCCNAPAPSRWTSLCLDLSCRSFGFLDGGVVFRVDFQEVVEDDEKHSCAPEENGERVQLAVCDHIDGGRALGRMER